MSRLVISICALAFLVSVGPSAADGVIKLEPLWTLGGLSAPESVATASDGKSLYVSNINGEPDAVDGNGFISRVSVDGKMLQEKFAVGLDGPKGLVLKGERLFVADITRLVEIDAKTGAKVASYDAPGATFLNDTALAPDGRILVSDSGTARIYVLDHGKISVYLEDPRLRSINGLLPEAGRLVIVTMEGLLLAMDWKTHAIHELANGLGDGDGIAPLGAGRYLVSEWPGRLFDVHADGSKSVLIDTRLEKTYINDFTLVGDTLYVPHLEPGSLAAFRVKL